MPNVYGRPSEPGGHNRAVRGLRKGRIHGWRERRDGIPSNSRPTGGKWGVLHIGKYDCFNRKRNGAGRDAQERNFQFPPPLRGPCRPPCANGLLKTFITEKLHNAVDFL